ncbi:hypothetical protein [uncultured Ramlibacter sp.]|uniref:hypothetical protein n=1 Tax=uncultured Ramlibacter sp. TaxID=260755 RepID=UPI002633DC0F|nr:hypothetical protein [uncultured Ramlibacter sp.]
MSKHPKPRNWRAFPMTTPTSHRGSISIPSGAQAQKDADKRARLVGKPLGTV